MSFVLGIAAGVLFMAAIDAGFDGSPVKSGLYVVVGAIFLALSARSSS